MNKLDIFCFTSVARTKSFSLTARELRISQQAVSKHIRNMENELGYQLFFRDCTPVELTKAGSYMLEYFTLRNGIIEQIAADIDAKNPIITLNIGFSQWTGSPQWFLDTVKKYHNQHPGIEIYLQNLDSNELLNAARTRNADILFTSRYMSHYLSSTWRCVPIALQPIFLIKSKRSSYLPDQLSLYPFYAPEAGESNTDMIQIRVRRICGQLGFLPQRILPCHDMGTVMLNILLNNGISLGSRPPKRGKIEDYDFKETGLYSELMICLPWQTDHPLIKDFASYIICSIEGEKL